MKHLCHVVARAVVGIIALASLIVVPVYAQDANAQLSPTTPKTTPDLSRLREQIKKTLSGSSKNSSLLNKNKKDDAAAGNEAAKPAEEPKKEGAPGDKAAPPESRAKTQPTKPARQQGAKSGQTGVRANGASGGGSGQGAVAVRTVGQGTYDPVKERPVEYADVPDKGEAMTLNGPVTVKEFIDTLVLATNWNALITEEAQKVSLMFWISEMKPKEALEVLKFHDIYYEYNATTKYLYVMTKQEYQQKKFGTQQEAEFVVKHASVDYIESVLSSLLSEKGRVLTDTRTQHIIVWDARDNLDKMKKTVEELDVPLDEELFSVKQADLADVETVFNMLVSPAGTVVADPRTGSLIVKDLKSNIEQMRAALAKLDVPLESRVFTVANVNADTVSESVESMLTERGSMQVDPHSNVLIVRDIATRQDQIGELLKTLDKKLETRTWTLNYVAPEDVSDRIESLVPEEMGSIVTDEDVHQITVTAVPDRIQQIDELVKSWDVKRRQVQIEAYLLTVSNDIQRKLGINWSYFDSNGNTPLELKVNDGATPSYTKAATNTFMLGQLPYASFVRNPFTGAVVKDVQGNSVIDSFHGNKVAAAIDFLDKHGDVSLLSTPRVTVQDGEEAIFQSGSQIPYVTSSSYSNYGNSYSPYSSYYSNPTTTTGTGTGTTTGTTGSLFGSTTGTSSNYNYNSYGSYGYGYQPYNRVEFMEVGTILNVMPRITDDGSILMDIAAEDSSADINNKVISNGQENTVPLKKQSRTETQVRVENGHTIVIGGLRTGNNSITTTKTVPILSDIPVLGRLFKNPSKTVSNANLMIFITPTIVGEATQPEAEQLAQVDQDIAKSLRKEDKTSFGRLAENATRGKLDIFVSVGQGGEISMDGKKSSVDELKARLQSVKVPAATLVVLRKHPRAPEEVIASVTDAALESHVRVECDTRAGAFVARDITEKKQEDAVPAPDKKTEEPAPAPSGDAKPAEEPKPAEAAKPAEEAKTAEAAKPAEEAKAPEASAPVVVDAKPSEEGK